MTFTTPEAWLLEAIIFSERSDNGAALTDIIASADYINHAIMTFEEFDSSARKLLKSELIIEKISTF